MKNFILFFLGMFCFTGFSFADEIPTVIIDPIQTGWDKTNDRDLSAPQLYQDDTHVYVYAEKQLDNLTIGITDMQGNVYYEEVTTVPACMYYAISIESFPEGMYYFTIIQGSNYVIGMFNL